MTETETGAYKAALEQVQRLLHDREYKLALEQVDAILEVHPGDAKTNFLRAVALRNLGQLDESISLLGELAKVTTGIAAVHQELGITLHAVGKIDDAIDALRAALAINSKLSTCWQLLGQCLVAEGEEAEAEEAMRRAIATSHTHPGILKALDLVREEKYGMAEGICRDYLQRKPTDVAVVRLLAEIGLKLGVRDDPVILLEDCLRMAPDYHLARHPYA
ncbi:MAG: tetratricopeptide repeat protein, partial [Halieaceae bacterium]|nr:tetratricopeptide repeat protein [Halieaceae bacterium]